MTQVLRNKNLRHEIPNPGRDRGQSTQHSTKRHRPKNRGYFSGSLGLYQ